MSVVLATLASMGMRLLTGKVIERVVMFALGELTKRTSSKADDELFKIVSEALKGK